jgi:hypothetical protein
MRLDTCASDIRLADFWGAKYRYDEEGVSLVTINTEKGSSLFDQVSSSLTIEKCSFDDLQDSQPKRFQLINKEKRDQVLDLLQGSKGLNDIYRKTIKPSFYKRLKRRASRIKRFL